MELNSVDAHEQEFSNDVVSVEPDPNEDEASQLKSLGNSFYAKDELDDAVTYWKASLKKCLSASCRSSNNIDYFHLCKTLRLNMSQAYIRQKRWVEGVETLKIVLKQEPENEKALYRKALCHLHMQEWIECGDLLRKLHSVNPENKVAIQLNRQLRSEMTKDSATKKSTYTKMMRKLNEDDSQNDSKLSNADTSIILSSDEYDVDKPNHTLWTEHHTADSLKKDKRVLYLSLPMTCVHALSLLNEERRNVILRKHKVVMYVIGARGDVELDCMWSSMLSRLPDCIQTLLILFIGFMDEDDPWHCKLKKNILSPPLSKTLGNKTILSFIFKGAYLEFKGIFEKEWHSSPDIVMIPEPAFNRHFDSWIPVFNSVMDMNSFCIVTGYTATEFPSHEHLNLPPILASLGCNITAQTQTNPFAINVKPDPCLSPMPCFQGYEKEPIMYCGPSAKNGVFCSFSGRKPNSDMFITDSEIQSLKSCLRDRDIDVDSGQEAREKWVASVEVNNDQKDKV